LSGRRGEAPVITAYLLAGPPNARLHHSVQHGETTRGSRGWRIPAEWQCLP
jgi:hypothetical protein